MLMSFFKSNVTLSIQGRSIKKNMKQRLIDGLTIFNAFCLCFLLFGFSSKNYESNLHNYADRILKVRGLVVVDSLGIERVIIGSQIPTSQSSLGNRLYPREKGTNVSGLMIYDSEGQERGGYVTDDDYGNAFLTLDSKNGQTFLALAEPYGATALQLWDRKGRNKISLETTDSIAQINIKNNNKSIKLYRDDK